MNFQSIRLATATALSATIVAGASATAMDRPFARNLNGAVLATTASWDASVNAVTIDLEDTRFVDMDIDTRSVASLGVVPLRALRAAESVRVEIYSGTTAEGLQRRRVTTITGEAPGQLGGFRCIEGFAGNPMIRIVLTLSTSHEQGMPDTSTCAGTLDINCDGRINAHDLVALVVHNDGSAGGDVPVDPCGPLISPQQFMRALLLGQLSAESRP